MNPTIKILILFCIVTLTYATEGNDDMRNAPPPGTTEMEVSSLEANNDDIPSTKFDEQMKIVSPETNDGMRTPKSLLSAADMYITDEDMEHVYENVEKTFIEAGHHEAAASVRAEWVQVAESISRRRLGEEEVGVKVPTTFLSTKYTSKSTKVKNAKNWQVDGGATGWCKEEKGGMFDKCIEAFSTVTTRINNIDTFVKAQGADVCYQPSHVSTNEDNVGDCESINMKPCDSSSWDVWKHDDACVSGKLSCASVNLSKIFVWGQMAVNIVTLVFTGGSANLVAATAVSKTASKSYLKTAFAMAKESGRKFVMDKMQGSYLKNGIKLPPSALRAKGMAQIKLLLKHSTMGSKMGAYNIRKNIAEHFMSLDPNKGITKALKEKLVEEIIWMDIIGEPMVLSSIVRDANVPAKAAWELAAVVDPTGISAVLKYYKDRRDSLCIFDDPPKLAQADVDALEVFQGSPDRYEAVHEDKMCSSTVAYSGSNTDRGKFNEELGRRFVDPSDCARSKALKNDCSSEIFQFNEETGSCQCCKNDISIQEDPTKKWSVFKLPTAASTISLNTDCVNDDKRVHVGNLAKNDVRSCMNAAKANSECGTTFFYGAATGWCKCESSASPCTRTSSSNYDEYSTLPGSDCWTEAAFQQLGGTGAHVVANVVYSGTTELAKDMSCCGQCQMRSDCDYWVREIDSNRCWLKSNDGNEIVPSRSTNHRGGMKRPGVCTRMEELPTFKENNFRAGDSTLDSGKVYTKDLGNGYKVDLSGWTHTRDYAGFLTNRDQTNPQALVYGLEPNTRYSYNIYQYSFDNRYIGTSGFTAPGANEITTTFPFVDFQKIWDGEFNTNPAASGVFTSDANGKGLFKFRRIGTSPASHVHLSGISVASLCVKECSVSLNLKTQHSVSACVYGSSYGCVSSGTIYVDNGCRATFTVNNIDILCESSGGARVECTTGGDPSNQCPTGWRRTFGKSSNGRCNRDGGTQTDHGSGHTGETCAKKCADDVTCVAFDIKDTQCYTNSKCDTQNKGDGYLSCTRKIPEDCPSGYERRAGFSSKIIGKENALDSFKRKASQPNDCKGEKPSYGKQRYIACKPVLDADVLRITSFDDLPDGETSLDVNECANKCNANGDCNAFEYSESTRYCYMLKDPEPEASSQELDFLFCAKPMDVTDRLNLLGYVKVGSGFCRNSGNEWPYAFYSDLLSMSECINHCQEETYCTGIAMTTKSHANPNRCYMYGEQKAWSAKWTKDISVSLDKKGVWSLVSGSGVVAKSDGSANAECWINPDYSSARSEPCDDDTPISGSEHWNSCWWHDNTYVCNNGKSCCCKTGFYPNSGGYCHACKYRVVKESVSKPRDNDQCVSSSSKDWTGYSCDSDQYCKSHPRTMKRCCPETCGSGEYNEAKCRNTNGQGLCQYPNDAQLQNTPDCDTSVKTDGRWYAPLDLPGKGRTVNTPEECRQRCVDTPECFYFNNFPDGGCHMAGKDATGQYRTTNPTVASGAVRCQAARRHFGDGQRYYKRFRSKYECVDAKVYLGKFDSAYGCAYQCLQRITCGGFLWGRDGDNSCTSMEIAGAHECKEWKWNEGVDFYQVYEGCRDMVPIFSDKEWSFWSNQDYWGTSDNWVSSRGCGANAYTCGEEREYCCCNQGYEFNWEGTCMATERCGATCTFALQCRDCVLDAKKDLMTQYTDVDTCAEKCMEDSKCFGFDFGKKDKLGKCFFERLNTQRTDTNKNYDAWTKVCSYGNGDPGYFASSATAESVVSIPAHFSMLHIFAMIGLIFISYSAFKQFNKNSEYVDVPSGVYPEEI